MVHPVCSSFVSNSTKATFMDSLIFLFCLFILNYCRTIGVQNTTVPHLNSYDFADSGIQTDIVSESDDEMPAEVPVEDENVEELIKDEENQENVGRGKEFSFCSSIYSIVRVNNNLYGTIG
jgi:hypothetical protein